MKEPSLSLSARIDIVQQGRLERAVRALDPAKIYPLRPLIKIARRYKRFVGGLLRERWPADTFTFRFHDDSFCFFVVPRSWWSWYRPDTLTLLETARANEREMLLKIVNGVDENRDPILEHSGDLDPAVTLRLLRLRFPRDRFGYRRRFVHYRYRFYLRH